MCAEFFHSVFRRMGRAGEGILFLQVNENSVRANAQGISMANRGIIRHRAKFPENWNLLIFSVSNIGKERNCYDDVISLN